MKTVVIERTPITLGQFLKFADIVSSGGEAKRFLSEGRVLVDGEPESRRGRKLEIGAVVSVEGLGDFKLVV